MTTETQLAALRKALSDEIVMVALRIKSIKAPITASTLPDHILAGRAIVEKHHDGLDKIMSKVQAALVEAKIDELDKLYRRASLENHVGRFYVAIIEQRTKILKAQLTNKENTL